MRIVPFLYVVWAIAWSVACSAPAGTVNPALHPNSEDSHTTTGGDRSRAGDSRVDDRNGDNSGAAGDTNWSPTDDWGSGDDSATAGDSTIGDAPAAGDPLPSGDTAPQGDSAPGVVPCAERDGGAFVTYDIASQEGLVVWVTDPDFIEESLAPQGRVPVFATLHDGTDCDSQWSWHVDPVDAFYTDFAIELCDGRPSDIEIDKAYWFASVKQYCPWDAKVVAVDDRRVPSVP